MGRRVEHGSPTITISINITITITVTVTITITQDMSSIVFVATVPTRSAGGKTQPIDFESPRDADDSKGYPVLAIEGVPEAAATYFVGGTY